MSVKIAVLTDPESAAGYRLAGLHVAVAQDATEARRILARMIEEETYALIAVSEALIPDPYQTLKREMRGRDLPVLLSALSPFAVEGEEAEQYMRQLILSTIGHEVKL